MKNNCQKNNVYDNKQERVSANSREQKVANRASCSVLKDKCSAERERNKKLTIWTIKIIIITFVLSTGFSYLSEITTSYAPLAIAFLLLLLLIITNIIFDAVAVAVTSCDLAPLLSIAARHIKGGQKAVMLVKNAEKVNNICADVIGDICGIISGACTVAIIAKLGTMGELEGMLMYITIAFSSIIAALTVGGKAVAKELAIKNSKEVIMFVGRVLSIFEKKVQK